MCFLRILTSSISISVPSVPVAFLCCSWNTFSLRWCTRSMIFSLPLFLTKHLNRHILSDPCSLHPIGRELIRSEYTWLTWPSALQPITCLSWKALWIASQLLIRKLLHSSTALSLPSQWFWILVRSFFLVDIFIKAAFCHVFLVQGIL